MLAKGSNGEDSTQTECNPTVPPRTTWSEAARLLGINVAKIDHLRCIDASISVLQSQVVRGGTVGVRTVPHCQGQLLRRVNQGICQRHSLAWQSAQDAWGRLGGCRAGLGSWCSLGGQRVQAPLEEMQPQRSMLLGDLPRGPVRDVACPSGEELRGECGLLLEQ